ncbi:glycosyltransferase family 4 protein [Noviherbaspirillum sp.]|uniref:glycosyltransferase family 4 protein n=1 Tax=Noviherbaspirillum sp. TaxID=1926288 RepID=UPI002D47DD27|nr:glycosyltransferase family 4 protein [Noviherbaspirillum sp.]HZW21407.1 glycosyltransferase family 4 protein [Noviherbaspirillum sp.]
MRILYINHYAGSPRHGMEYRPHYMASNWLRMGHDVTVVAATASHLRQKSPDTFQDMAEEMVEGVRYVWLKTPAYEGNGLRRVRNMASFVFSLYRFRKHLVQAFRPDVVIASSTYTWDIFPARTIARLAGAKLVFEVHDLWPLSPMQLGGMPRYHPFIMSLQWGEDYACRHADVVVSMLPYADKHLCGRGMDRGKFHYVPNGIDLEEWQASAKALPAAHRAVLESCRRDGQFIVCYAGSHGLSDALDILVDTAAEVRDQPVAFLLVGQGPDKARLRERAMLLGLKNVHFLDPVPKAAIPDLLRSADCLYIGGKDQPLYQFGISPNKIMDYMASGRPVVSAFQAGNDAIGEAGCGFSVKSEDPVAIGSAILKLMEMPAAERERMGDAGRAYVRAHHDYTQLAQKFLQAL